MKAFFQEIALAVSNFKFYKQAKDFQMGKGMKYIFSFIFLITLILTVKTAYDVRGGLNIAAEWTKENLPVIEIQKGIVSVDAKQPFKIIEEGFALIIDTTGEITSLDGYETGVLLMKDKLIYKENEYKTETHDLSNVEELKIDENFMNTLKRNAAWIVFPFVLLWFFIRFCIAKFLQISILSLIFLPISAIANIKLNYRQLFIMSIYAITAGTILGALLEFFGIALPFFSIIYAGLCIIYLVMAMLNCKEASAKTQP